MGCGIQGPHPIEGCARPSQCGPGKRSHGGTEEQENADDRYSARHVLPTNFVGVRAGAVSHLLTILKFKNSDSLAARGKLSTLLNGDLLYGSLPLRLGDQFELF